MMLELLLLLAVAPSPAGPWRAALNLAGGELRFSLDIGGGPGRWTGQLCNGPACQAFSGISRAGDTLVFEMGEYAASITAVLKQDSLVGRYSNVGRRGPRVIPFRASRGRWAPTAPRPELLGRWDAWFLSGFDQSPRVLEFRNGRQGLEGTVISNSGDYGLFWGTMTGDSVALAHFDGSFVYLLTGQLAGDTLRGTFHAGLRTQTAFVATRSSGRQHLTPPGAVTRADTSARFSFAFPDLEGRRVSSDDPRFRGKVVLVDIFGTWCPTCHDAAPALARLYQRFRGRGLEVVGIAFEVTGDTAQDAPLLRRYRDKYGLAYPLLLGGISEAETVAEAFPQLDGFTAFPTTIFLGRDGRVRRVHAGFYGPATGAQHDALVAEFCREVARLLEEEGRSEE